MKYSFHLQEFWLHHHVLYWEWTDAGDLRKYGSDHKRMKVNKADEFYKILERKSIYPVFQPIVNLQTGRGSCFWYCIRNNREIRHRKLSDIAADHETLCKSGIWDSIGWCGSWTFRPKSCSEYHTWLSESGYRTGKGYSQAVSYTHLTLPTIRLV